MYGQPPSLPHQPEAEAALLGGILLSSLPERALAEAVNVIGDEHSLFMPGNVAVFRAMRILAERGQPIDVITLQTQLRTTGELELCGGIEGLARLDKYATAQNITAHAEIVRESARTRALALLGRQMQDVHEVEDLDAYIAQRQAELAQLAQSPKRQRKTVSMREALDRTFAEMAREAHGEGIGVSTGFPRLDEMIKRTGPRGGMLLVIGAPPKFGKTTFALSITRPYERAAGWPVNWVPKRRPARTLWACDEMRIPEVIQRQLADVTSLDGRAIGSPTARWLERHMDQLAAARRMLESCPVDFVDDADSHHLDRIFDYARHWRAKHPIIGRTDGGKPIREPAILVLDYLQRFADLPTTIRGATKTERVGDKVRACKTIAQELDIVVVLLSQLNRAYAGREGAEKRPGRSDFRDSGEIEAEADVLIGLHRPIEFDKNADEVREKAEWLANESKLPIDDLDAVVAHHGQTGVPKWVAELREQCQIQGSVLEDLIEARKRLSATEVIVIANRHGPTGTVHADFFGKSFRFLPMADPNGSETT